MVSLGLDTCFACALRVLLEVTLQERSEFFGTHGHGLKIETSKELDHVRHLHHLACRCIEPVDDRSRHAARTVNAIPTACFIAFESELVGSWNIGQFRAALERREGEWPQPPGMDHRHHHGAWAEHERYVSG